MILPYSNLEIRHWNPGASMPLVMPVQMLCNTSDEQINENVRANSRLNVPWIKQIPKHDGVALLCGGGPSLADSLQDIRNRIAEGGTVFALNGAASFLASRGIMPDAQVILDARPETAQLIGPAKRHLFASQAHPSLFAQVPTAELWQLQIEGIDDLLPDDAPHCTLIGGAASVGNTATCLAFALGFRDLHCFGYDSSFRDDKGHAYSQPMNDGDPCAMVPWRGKHYRVSLTMKLQAEKFQSTARVLKEAGAKVFVHGSGLLPDIYNAGPTGLSEQQKYEAMWDIPQYRIVAPGVDSAAEFVARLGVAHEHTVIDFGAGTGRGAVSIAQSGAAVTLVDFTANSRDPIAQKLPFVQSDLSLPMTVRGDVGYCTDVMEHIPPEQVDSVLENILECVPVCFFAIDYCEDLAGAYIGEALHLSIHDHQWWLDTFMRLGMGVEWSRDDGGRGCFHVIRHAVETAARAAE